MSVISQNNTLMLKGIVTCDSNSDPLGAGRYQVYIPSLHGVLDTNRVGPENNTNTGTSGTTKAKYPWAEYLSYEETPSVGTYVLIGSQGNDNNSLVILGKYGNIDSSISSLGINIAGGNLAELAAEVIFGNEGNYTSVNWNDNGAISIGKIQWHANRARDLLLDIRSKNTDKFDSTASGTSITSDLSQNWSHWTNYSAGSPTGNALKSILGSDESKKAQDETAISDVQSYITTIQKGGITDPATVIYLADIMNQYGSCNDLIRTKINNIDKMHQYALSNGYGTYASRRTNTYNKVKQLEQQGKFTIGTLSTEGSNATATGSGTVGWPTSACSPKDKITSPYGPRGSGFHNGIDIGVPIGSDVLAPINGTVLSLAQYGDKGAYDRIKDGVGGYGYYQIVIADQQINGNWYGVLMAHQRALGSLNNVKVSRGAVIGKSGNTGNSTGPHIHFEIRKLSNGTVSKSNYFSGKTLDPQTMI